MQLRAGGPSEERGGGWGRGRAGGKARSRDGTGEEGLAAEAPSSPARKPRYRPPRGSLCRRVAEALGPAARLRGQRLPPLRTRREGRRHFPGLVVAAAAEAERGSGNSSYVSEVKLGPGRRGRGLCGGRAGGELFVNKAQAPRGEARDCCTIGEEEQAGGSLRQRRRGREAERRARTRPLLPAEAPVGGDGAARLLVAAAREGEDAPTSRALGGFT